MLGLVDVNLESIFLDYDTYKERRKKQLPSSRRGETNSNTMKTILEFPQPLAGRYLCIKVGMNFSRRHEDEKNKIYQPH